MVPKHNIVLHRLNGVLIISYPYALWKMADKNIGIVIGPNLLWPPGKEPGEVVEDQSPLSILLETFLM